MTTNLGFVTGYPRSRTAWLSEFLTIAGFSFAFHEADMGDDGSYTKGSCINKMLSRNERYVIDCSSGHLLAPEVMDCGKVVLILRDRAEALESYRKFHASDEASLLAAWDMFAEGMDRVAERSGVLAVPFSQLSDESTCISIGQFLCPGFEMDPVRFSELKKKNIQQYLPYWQRFKVG